VAPVTKKISETAMRLKEFYISIVQQYYIEITILKINEIVYAISLKIW